MRDLENVNTDSAARQSTICQSSIKLSVSRETVT